MMDPGAFWLFVAASWALIVTPGPDVMYVVTRAAVQGRGAGVWSAAGICTGCLVHTTVAALGLAVVLYASAAAFTAVKYVGAGYLLYMGVQTIRGRKGPRAAGVAGPPVGRSKLFVQGLICNVLNPKVALFFLAFLPQFVAPDGFAPGVQMMIMGLLYAVWGFMFLSVLGLLSGRLGDRLAGRPKWPEKMSWVGGAVMIALGLRLALTRPG